MAASLKAKIAVSMGGVAMVTAVAGTGASLLQTPSAPPASTPSPPAATVPMSSDDALSDPVLDGKWQQTHTSVDGGAPPRVVYNGRTGVFTMPDPGGGETRIVWEIIAGDPDADPAYMTTQITEVSGAGAPMFRPMMNQPSDTIYRVEGDEMTFAAYNPFAQTERDRPDDFEPEPGKQIMTMFRTSDRVQSRNEQGFIHDQLIGEWSPEGTQAIKIEDGLMTVTSLSGEVIAECEVLSWDARVSPRRMEIVYIQSDYPQIVGLTQQLIYNVQGDQLRMAAFATESPRYPSYPDSFDDSTRGDLLYLNTFERRDE